MIAAAYCGEIGPVVIARSTDRSLYSHFHSHFDGNRSGIGIKYIVHGGRRHAEQDFAKFDSRFMSKASEHHMAHFVELPLGRLIDSLIVVAVDFAPP